MRRQILIRPDTPIVRLGGRLPKVVALLLSLQVGLHVLCAFVDAPVFLRTHLQLSSGRALGHFELWQPLTALWFHVGTRSLILNGLCLWIFGSALVRWWGPRHFLVYWSVTGSAGLLAAMVVGLGWPNELVGGSGGASLAMLVATATLFPHHLVFLHGLVPLQCRWICALLAAFVVFGSLLDRAFLDVVMAAGGALVGWLMLYRQRRGAPAGQRSRPAVKPFQLIDGGRKSGKHYLN